VWAERYDDDKIYYRRHICEPTGVSEREVKRGISVISCEVGGEFLVYMPQEGEVNVEIYDIMGRKVANESFSHPGGEYRFRWRGEHSGVYFFKFKIKDTSTYKGEEIIKKVVMF
jgi:hypothetical protein